MRSWMGASVALVVAVAAGLGARAVLSGPVADVTGVALYAVAVYSLVRLLRPATELRQVATISLLFCWFVELAQLTPWPAAASSRSTLARLVLGSTFTWSDLAAYAIGVAFAVSADLAVRHWLAAPERDPRKPARFHRRTRKVLQRAGWHVGRRVDTVPVWEAELVLDGYPPLHSTARRFLAEFGGLAVRNSGPGVSCAREPFVLVPTECSGEADRFIGWSEHISRSIAPIGEHAGNNHGWANLGIDEDGEVYLVGDRLTTLGRMPSAMDHLVLGHMPREIA